MHIPKEWHELLARVRTLAPDAHLAGGALRDLDNGRPIKDLDIFTRTSVDPEALERVIGTHAFSSAIDGQYTDNMIAVETAIRYVPRCTCPSMEDDIISLCATDHGSEINLIVLKQEYADIEKNIRRFDFGICQIALDLGGEVVRTGAYIEDKERNEFTLRVAPNADCFGLSLKRYRRLQEKYARWPLVLKPEFVDFVR